MYIKEALLLKQALSLCSSMVEEKARLEAAYFEAVRIMLVRLTAGGAGKKLSLPEINEKINELLKHSIKSSG
ncbi:type I restriction enzyme endonuclease domain-containing protein, partial [Mailhella massiliensis]|uniref:type I restriction enzyme endonuclease domain-containing protein n=1 Tax=Mailhella massiliensis TaxID=1903261 RepID=UPI0026EC6707